MDTQYNPNGAVYNPSGASYVEWSTVLAGTALALAVSIVFLQFGSAVGVANLDDLRTDVELTPMRFILAAVFVLFTQLISSLLGGYVAGRMRAPMTAISEHEREVRDGIHGVAVWATSTVAVVIAVSVGSFMADLVSNSTPVDTNQAQEVLNREHNFAIILAFATAATSLVSAVAAYFAATKGGDHRDMQTDLSRHLSFRRTRV